MFQFQQSNKFKKDYKKLKHSGKDMALLKDIMRKIILGESLQLKYKDHKLIGLYKGYRECHIEPDWLLIFKKDTEKKVITFARTGTHSELFE